FHYGALSAGPLLRCAERCPDITTRDIDLPMMASETWEDLRDDDVVRFLISLYKKIKKIPKVESHFHYGALSEGTLVRCAERCPDMTTRDIDLPIPAFESWDYLRDDAVVRFLISLYKKIKKIPRVASHFHYGALSEGPLSRCAERCPDMTTRDIDLP